VKRDDPFEGFPRGHYRAILADPPSPFLTRSEKGKGRSADRHYQTMSWLDISMLPVEELAAPNCALFLWATWPTLPKALRLIDVWGFEYKTCAFDWVKVNKDGRARFGLGYWTRSNTEPCLLATRGHPKRLNADVSQVIVTQRREHSRKPDQVRSRIERLVAGPYLELFARSDRRGWSVWGDEVGKFTEEGKAP
jgi:N6-adenosine-specific RNA methylase IME4